MQDKRTHVPTAAGWLGGLGALPFVAPALALALAPPEALGGALGPALVAYGAVILSFLGAVHWGLAIAPAATVTATATAASPALSQRLGGSVVPSLVGWVALLLPMVSGLVVLAAAFAAMLAIDWRAARRGVVPAWYPALRLPLSLAAIASLLLAAAAVAARAP